MWCSLASSFLLKLYDCMGRQEAVVIVFLRCSGSGKGEDGCVHVDSLAGRETENGGGDVAARRPLLMSPMLI